MRSNGYGQQRLIPRWVRRCLCGALVVGLAGWLSSWAWAETSQSVEVTAVIEPRLSLTVEPATGERLDLGTIDSSPTETSFSRQVPLMVRVASNLYRSHAVTHHLAEPLTSEAGISLDPEQLRYHLGQRLATSGILTDEPQVAFFSDPQLGVDERSISYQLRVPPAQPAGRYRGTLLLTVTAP